MTGNDLIGNDLIGNDLTEKGLTGNEKDSTRRNSTGMGSTKEDLTVIVNSETVSLIFILIMNIKLKTAESSKVSYIHVYSMYMLAFKRLKDAMQFLALYFNNYSNS